MSISDDYAAPQQMDTSADTSTDLDLSEEEEEEIERAVAELCDQPMTDEVTAVFSGQDPGIVEQHLRYAQETSGGREQEEEEEESVRYAAVSEEDLQNPDRYARDLAAQMSEGIWQDFVVGLGGEESLADESDTELQAAATAAKDALFRQAYDSVLAKQSLLKNGSQEQ